MLHTRNTMRATIAAALATVLGASLIACSGSDDISAEKLNSIDQYLANICTHDMTPDSIWEALEGIGYERERLTDQGRGDAWAAHWVVQCDDLAEIADSEEPEENAEPVLLEGMYPSVWTLPEFPHDHLTWVQSIDIRYDGYVRDANYRVEGLTEAEADAWLADAAPTVNGDVSALGMRYQGFAGDEHIRYQLPAENQGDAIWFRVTGGPELKTAALRDPNAAITLSEEWAELPIPADWTFKNAWVRYNGKYQEPTVRWDIPQYQLVFTDDFPDPVGAFNEWTASLIEQGWELDNYHGLNVSNDRFTIQGSKDGTGYYENGHTLWISVNEGADLTGLPQFAPES